MTRALAFVIIVIAGTYKMRNIYYSIAAVIKYVVCAESMKNCSMMFTRPCFGFLKHTLSFLSCLTICTRMLLVMRMCSGFLVKEQYIYTNLFLSCCFMTANGHFFSYYFSIRALLPSARVPG